MGKRSRQRAAGPQARAPRLRGEAAAEATRAGLEPLAPGQRPGAVTVAAIAAGLLGVLNVALYAAGVRAAGGSFGGTVVVGLVLLVAAWGMWRSRYWAVLGFECLLGITAVFAALSLLVASSIGGAVRATVVLVAAGWLFYKLVRAMARLQMPTRRPPAGTR